MGDGYIKLNDLFVYKISLELCDMGWEIYESFNWQTKKIIGDQFITAVDSNAANIAEGYGRYHHRDKIKFYYNAQASLLESRHWIHLLHKRGFVDDEKYEAFTYLHNHVSFHLNKFINDQYEAMKKEPK